MNMQKEPAIIVATITGFITALIALLVAFGIDLSEEQRNAILGMIGPMVAVFPLLGVAISRFVYSPNSVKNIQNQAYDAGVPPTEPKPVLPSPADKDGGSPPAFEDHPDSPFIKKLPITEGEPWN